MNRAKHTWLSLSLLALALWLLPVQAQAVVLDWDSVTWTEAEGAFSKSFEIDSNNPGNDITITITGDTDKFVQDPHINNQLTGGLSPTQDGLFLRMNYSDENESVTVTVTFNYAYGVEDVSFSIFDIDRNDSGSSNVGYRDRIDLLGKDMSDGLIAPTTITEHPDNDVRNSGSTNVYVRGDESTSDSSSDANADYTFSGTNAVIKEFFFTYGNHSSAPDNPGNQWITLHDITYKPKVPEWHPGLIASFACLMLVGVRRFFF